MRCVWINRGVKMGLKASSLVLLLALTACGQAADRNAAAMEAYQASMDAAASANLKAGEAYLADVARQPGVVKLPDDI